jgi:hydroxymethylpyrimidine/phosphomethylpyrimidine kinase
LAAPARSRPSVSRPLPCVLAIGGLDPGGGAGILADARAIERAGAFACAAVALLTVQSTSGMRAAHPVPKASLLAQCNEVVKHQRVRAFKLGALGSDDNVRAIADFLAIHRRIPAVVDTVMIPTRGSARLLDERAVARVRERVLPRAALVTANAPEAEVLAGMRVTRLDEAHDAAVAIVRLGAGAVLVKGGHIHGPKAIDVLAFPSTDGRGPPRCIELRAARLDLPGVHGGGCVLASLVAGRLAVSGDWADDPERAIGAAVRWAKRVHHDALAEASDVGGDLRVILA